MDLMDKSTYTAAVVGDAVRADGGGVPLRAEEAQLGLTESVAQLTDVVWYPVLIVLLGTGLYCTVATRGVQVRWIPEMFRLLVQRPSRGGRGTKASGTPESSDGSKSSESSDGADGISPFRAFTISAGGRIGTGNIAGVSVALTVGGPGAIFWMWVVATVGGATAFAESTLAQAYKERAEEAEGEVFRGGPAYYLKSGLRNSPLAAAFALTTIVTFGLIFATLQSNAVVDVSLSSIADITGSAPSTMTTALVSAVVTLLAIASVISGVHRLSTVTNVLVPLMALLYLVTASIVVILHAPEVPGMVADIVRQAFGIGELVGGGLGAIIVTGVRRGLFSSEAGMGSVPHAAATATVSHPVKQGFVQSLGVYADTLIVCSLTAFVVILGAPDYASSDEARGASLTQEAIAGALGGWTLHLMTAIIAMLAFSSLLADYVYSHANIRYLQGNRGDSATAGRWWLVFFGAAAFIGGVLSTPTVWTLGDLFMALMTTLNVLGVVALTPVVAVLLRDYQRQRAAGHEPVFHLDAVRTAVAQDSSRRARRVTRALDGVSCWD